MTDSSSTINECDDDDGRPVCTADRTEKAPELSAPFGGLLFVRQTPAVIGEGNVNGSAH